LHNFKFFADSDNPDLHTVSEESEWVWLAAIQRTQANLSLFQGLVYRTVRRQIDLPGLSIHSQFDLDNGRAGWRRAATAENQR
jgi:hypothetical protein